MVLYESDDLEYVSDDDLGQELDLEVYGIKVTPQPSIPGENTPCAGIVHAVHVVWLNLRGDHSYENIRLKMVTKFNTVKLISKSCPQTRL